MNKEEYKKMWNNMLEKLNEEEIHYLAIVNNQKNQEIERLKNIINELEKWLKDKQNLTCGCGITVDYLYAYENCLDKLKELKEE